MQLLSAYLLESPALSEADLATFATDVREHIADWLRNDKAVADPHAAVGDFHSRTRDGSGSFAREAVVLPKGTLEELRLEEFTRAGQIFTTYLATVAAGSRLRVYCTLNVTNAESVVAPLPLDPRCPAIVRTLLGRFGGWQLHGAPLPAATPARWVAECGGRALAAEIRRADRALPIVVVSEIEGEPLWPQLAEGIAFDLAGLASVVAVDEDASLALSDEVGKLHSCYRGAVRLYWPPRRRADGEADFHSTVWTASVLLSNDRDGKGDQRLRKLLRRTLMSTAALAITPPADIRALQEASARQRLNELTRRADSHEALRAEADHLRCEKLALNSRIEVLQAELARTAARAESAEHALDQVRAPSLVDEDDASAAAEPGEPVTGEARFYKKTHSKSTYDVLVPVADCGHTAWQASNKADKARKGIERLLGRNDWKSLQHCGSCTGGGMWKVRW
jgi:hypothetical protein